MRFASSILWEWLHKGATLTADDPGAGVKAGDTFTPDLFRTLLAEEYAKLLAASNRDVHDVSKTTTLPISREIVETYVTEAVKMPWFVDLLNVNLGNSNLRRAAGGSGCWWTRSRKTGRGLRRIWISTPPDRRR